MFIRIYQKLTFLAVFTLLGILSATASANPIYFPIVNPCIFLPNGCTQDCGQALMVNKAESTGTQADHCKTQSCGIDSAIARANQCAASNSVTVNFDSNVFPASSIDLSSAGFTQVAYLVGGSHPITIDGGSSRVLIKGNDTVDHAFQANAAGVSFKNLVFQNFKKSALVIGAAATNTDIQNVSISSNSNDDAIRVDSPVSNNSNNNVPVFIRPGPNAGQFVAYVILPKDSDIHFYAKNGNKTEWTGIEYNLLPNPDTGKLDYSDLLDNKQNPIDSGSMQIVAGFLGGFTGTDKIIALVKNKDKNISIVRSGLPNTFFTDSDQDYLSDDAENTWFGTNPNNADSDANQVQDYVQVIDQNTQVPRAKKNVDGTYSFVALDAIASAQGNENTQDNSKSNSGGGCSLESANSSANWGFLWLAGGLLFLKYRRSRLH